VLLRVFICVGAFVAAGLLLFVLQRCKSQLVHSELSATKLRVGAHQAVTPSECDLS
jgi:hypothetical protein